MSKIISIEKYKKLTKNDKLKIEELFFKTIKEEMETLFPFLKIEKVEFNNYWEKVDYESNRWRKLSGFVLSNGNTYVRLPDINTYMDEYSNIEYSRTLYDIQENIFEFFRLPDSTLGVVLAWGNGDYHI